MGSRRHLHRLGVGTAGIVGFSGTAGAHGPHGHGGDPITFGVVIALPVVAGLGGGAVAVRRTARARTGPISHWAGIVLGGSLAVLGVTFSVAAIATSHSLGIAGGAVGVLSALWVTRSDGTEHRACRADLALGAVSAHRLLEGVAIGALYSAGSAIGLLGAVLLAGHTALEAAAVGGMYAIGPVRSRAFGAILLVQGCYAGGAIVGPGLANLLPVSTRALALSVAGGALLIVGTGETARSVARG